MLVIRIANYLTEVHYIGVTHILSHGVKSSVSFKMAASVAVKGVLSRLSGRLFTLKDPENGTNCTETRFLV